MSGTSTYRVSKDWPDSQTKIKRKNVREKIGTLNKHGNTDMLFTLRRQANLMNLNKHCGWLFLMTQNWFYPKRSKAAYPPPRLESKVIKEEQEWTLKPIKKRWAKIYQKSIKNKSNMEGLGHYFGGPVAPFWCYFGRLGGFWLPNAFWEAFWAALGRF